MNDIYIFLFTSIGQLTTQLCEVGKKVGRISFLLYSKFQIQFLLPYVWYPPEGSKFSFEVNFKFKSKL